LYGQLDRVPKHSLKTTVSAFTVGCSLQLSTSNMFIREDSDLWQHSVGVKPKEENKMQPEFLQSPELMNWPSHSKTTYVKNPNTIKKWPIMTRVLCNWFWWRTCWKCRCAEIYGHSW